MAKKLIEKIRRISTEFVDSGAEAYAHECTDNASRLEQVADVVTNLTMMWRDELRGQQRTDKQDEDAEKSGAKSVSQAQKVGPVRALEDSWSAPHYEQVWNFSFTKLGENMLWQRQVHVLRDCEMTPT